MALIFSVAAAASLTVKSPAFSEGGVIPARFTCEGDDVSPPLAWTDAPAETKSFALVVEDPDAPDPKSPNRKTFTHWIVYDIASGTRGLPEGAKTAPPGARNGENDFGSLGYRGPCPPSGEHRYVFKVYALDTVLPDLNKPHAVDLDRAMNGHVISQGRLVGLYQKGRGPRS
jgi:Raf kinase inhibitor-like YbhB/YbcL family protein